MDTSSWVSALTALKNAKVQTLQEEKSAVIGIKDVVSSIKTYFTSFRNSLERLTDAKFGTDSLDMFVQNLANSSNPSKVTASATSAAARDTYEVGVTQVASSTKANTAVRRTVTVTQTASGTTKLSVIGVQEGYVSINNKEIQITNSDTINSLVEKMNDIGINASYDEDKGRFTIASDIYQIDDGITNMISSLKLEISLVDGEQSKQLMTEGYVTIKPTTSLADIGAVGGDIIINETLVNMNLGTGATVQTFLDYMNTNYGAGTATMDAEGYITVTGVDVEEVAGGSNIITALGLVEKVDSVSASTGNLAFEKTEAITTASKLGEINTSFANHNLVLSNGTTTQTVTMTATSSIGDVITQIENYATANGMNADIQLDEDGVISIGGDIDKLHITGGVADGLGLDMESVNGTSMTSSALEYTHTMTSKSSTTFGELGLSGSSLTYNILDERGNAIVSNASVTADTTFEQWFNSMKQYGINGSISEEGVVSIDGDGLVSGGLATALGLGQVVSGQVISGTTAESNALGGTTTATATMTSSLQSMGMSGNQYLTITNGATTVTKTFAQTATLQEVANAITAAGGTVTLSETGEITITGVDKLQGSIVNGLNLNEQTVDGNSLYSSTLTYTLHSIATEATKLSDLGITGSNLGFNVYNDKGALVAATTLTSTATVGDFFDTLETYGLKGSIDENGVISIEDGYITGNMATKLGLTFTATDTIVTSTTIVSNALAGTTTTTATMTSSLGSLGITSGKNLVINGTTYNFTTADTLQTVANAITGKGGTFTLEDNQLILAGADISGTLLDALGLHGNTVNGTTVYSTGINYTIGSIATTGSKFSDFGLNISGKSYNIYSQTGDLLASGLTLASDATIADLEASLGSYGINLDVNANGEIVISNGYITGDLATTLGITSNAYKTIVAEQSLVSKGLTASTYTTASLNTTLGSIGLSGTQYLTINYNGTVSGYNFNANSTIADIRDAIVSAGGSLTMDDGYINVSYVELSGTLASNLGLNKTNGNVTTTTTTEVQYTVNTMTITTTATATAITTTTAIITLTVSVTTTAVATGTFAAQTTITTSTSATVTANASTTAYATCTAYATATVTASTSETTYASGTVYSTAVLSSIQANYTTYTSTITTTTTQTITTTQTYTTEVVTYTTSTIVTTTSKGAIDYTMVTIATYGTMVCGNVSTWETHETFAYSGEVMEGLGLSTSTYTKTDIRNMSFSAVSSNHYSKLFNSGDEIVYVKSDGSMGTINVGSTSEHNTFGGLIDALSSELDITIDLVTQDNMWYLQVYTDGRSAFWNNYTLDPGGFCNLVHNTLYSGSNIEDNLISYSVETSYTTTALLGTSLANSMWQTYWVSQTITGSITGLQYEAVYERYDNSDYLKSYAGNNWTMQSTLNDVCGGGGTIAFLGTTASGETYITELYFNGQQSLSEVNSIMSATMGVSFTVTSSGIQVLGSNYDICVLYDDVFDKAYVGEGVTTKTVTRVATGTGEWMYVQMSSGGVTVTVTTTTTITNSTTEERTREVETTTTTTTETTTTWSSVTSYTTHYTTKTSSTTYSYSLTAYASTTVTASTAVTASTQATGTSSATYTTVQTQTDTVAGVGTITSSATATGSAVAYATVTASTSATATASFNGNLYLYGYTSYWVETTASFSAWGQSTSVTQGTWVTLKIDTTKNASNSNSNTGYASQVGTNSNTASNSNTEVKETAYYSMYGTSITTTTTKTVSQTTTTSSTTTVITTTTEEATSTYVDAITHTVTKTLTESLVYRSGQKTYGISSTTFNASDTKLSQIGITNGTVLLKDNVANTTTTIFTVGTNTTVSDLIAAFELNGYEATFSNGRISLTTDDDITLQDGTSNAISALAFTTAKETVTYFQNSTSNAYSNAATNTLQATTALSIFTSNTSDRILELEINGEKHYKTFNGSNTVSDIVSYLNSKGITASFSNGTLSASASNFEFALGGTLGNIIVGSNPTITTTSKTGSWEGMLGASVNGVAINGNTKIVDLGVEEGSVKIYNNGEYIDKAINISANTTINDLISSLQSYGFNASLTGGKLQISSPNANMYLVNESSNLVSKLGLTKTEGFTTLYTSSTSSTLSYDKTYTITGSTTLADMGYNEGAELRLSVDGTLYSLAFSGNESVNDVIRTLDIYGIDATINNGVFSANSTEHTFTIGGEVGNILLGASPTTNTITTVTGYNGQLNDSVNAVAINNDTKLVDLGVTTGGLKVYDNGTWINTAISIDENTTINDLISALNGYGINASLDSGKLKIQTDSDKYVADEGSNLISKLGLTSRNQATVNVYDQTNSKTLTVVTTHTTAADTTLRDLGFGTGASLRLEIGGVMQTIGFTAEETVQDVIDSLATYGIDAKIENGIFSATNTDKTFKITGTLAEKLNGAAPTYITTEKVLSYQSEELDQNNTYTADGNTKLTDLGVTTGYINVLRNGEILTTVAVEDNTTVSQFFSALSAYGVAGNIDANGKISLETIGDVTLMDGTSNLVTHFGLDNTTYSCTYEGTTMVIEDNVNLATEETLVSYFDKPGQTAEGSLYFTLEDQDGNSKSAVVNIAADDTIGDVVQKLRNIGLDVKFENGVISYHNGLGEATITGGSSALIDTLEFNNATLETWYQNPDEIDLVKDEIRYLSIVNYADANTKMETLGVIGGELSIGVNGAVYRVNIDENDTVQNVISRISSATGGSVTASLTDDGKFKLEAAAGIELLVGTSTDTTNLATIFNLSQDGSNVIVGGTSLYKASASSKITEAGIFRLGNVTEGTFTIGNAEFTITSETTIASLINEINRNEAANTSAYWDNINGKLVITSNALGASYVNVQGGTSNITEIFGLTTNDGGVERLATYNQKLGDNAILTINGTRIVATSNTITSDISRIEGLTVNVKDVTAGDYVTITVERDTQAIVDTVQEALDSYNTLIAELNTVLNVGGKLHGDVALNAIKNQLSSILTSKGTNGTTVFRNLAAVGISTEAASKAMATDIFSLYLDTNKFTKALEESEQDVKLLLVGTVDNPGIFTRVENILENALATAGYFSTKNSSLNREIADYDKKIAKANAHADSYKALLERKFSNMELLYSQMQSSYSNLLSGGIA